jgi:hypothetical protein
MNHVSPRRRALLKSLGLLGPAYFLPALRAGAAEAPPRRLVVIQTVGGWLRKHWDPSGGESDFTLGKITAPLEPWKDKCIFLNGLAIKRFTEYKNMPGGTPDGHISGSVHTLTSPGQPGPRRRPVD